MIGTSYLQIIAAHEHSSIFLQGRRRHGNCMQAL